MYFFYPPKNMTVLSFFLSKKKEEPGLIFLCFKGQNNIYIVAKRKSHVILSRIKYAMLNVFHRKAIVCLMKFFS